MYRIRVTVVLEGPRAWGGRLVATGMKFFNFPFICAHFRSLILGGWLAVAGFMHFTLVVAGASFFVANSVRFVKWTQMACTWSWVCDSGLMGVLIPGASNVGASLGVVGKIKAGADLLGSVPSAL